MTEEDQLSNIAYNLVTELNKTAMNGVGEHELTTKEKLVIITKAICMMLPSTIHSILANKEREIEYLEQSIINMRDILKRHQEK